MRIPAICDTCSAIFPSGLIAGNAFSITLSGNKSGPCPKCGGMGHLPDGTFNFINDTIELISAPQRTIDELKALKSILENAKKNEATLEEIKDLLSKSKDLGELRTISDFFPKTRTDLYAFIMIAIAVLTLILNNRSHQMSTNQIINTTIDNIYIQQSR